MRPKAAAEPESASRPRNGAPPDRSSILVNTPGETTYFYQDLDQAGDRLNGEHAYTVTFARNSLPPVRGFWSPTLYNEHHFFHPNPLNRCSLGTKNTQLKADTDRSVTLTEGTARRSVMTSDLRLVEAERRGQAVTG
jgi:hypothetical protein